MRSQTKRVLAFDDFRIDTEERQLLRNGTPLQLTPKVFELLLLLAENRGHTLSKDELMGILWPGTFTEENNLSRNISMLRKALGEDFHSPRYIRTVPKLGYRFESPVEEIELNGAEVVYERHTDFSLEFSEEIDHGTFGVIRSVITSSLQKIGGWRRIAATVLVGSIAFGGFYYMAPESDAKPLHPAIGGTKNAEAYTLFEQGRAHWRDRSAAGLHQSILLLERAVEMDPNFALAHAALADAYAFDIQSKERAVSSAENAIRLESRLGEPYATLGFIRLFWDWDPIEAERHFKKALTLSPNYATGHQWYSMQLAASGRLNEALSEIERAAELESDSPAVTTDMCRVMYFLQRHDDAEAWCLKAISLTSASFEAHRLLYEIYVGQQRYDEAVEAFFASESQAVNNSALPSDLDSVRKAYYLGGIRVFWRKLIEIRNDPQEDREYASAKYHALLGEHEKAVKGLRRAYEKRDFGYIMLSAEPVFRDYFRDPELAVTVNRIFGRETARN